MREQAGRAAVAAHRGQVVGRHERRRHLVEVGQEHPTSREATRATQHPTPATRAVPQATQHPTPATRAATRATQDPTRAATRATRAGRARRGARPGWAARVARARRALAGGRAWWAQGGARAWWAEGTDRFAGRPRAKSRARLTVAEPASWNERAAAADQPPQRPEQGPRHLAAVPRGRPANLEELITGWSWLLLVLGLYLDGVSGTAWFLCLACAVTATWILTRGHRRGAWSLEAVPPGYRVALAGVGLGMVAVAGDAGWHAVYGPAGGLARLVAPFHLLLLAGGCLLGGSVLRAAWSGPASARVPGLRGFWPVVGSTALVVAMVAFFFQPVSPLAAQPPGGLLTQPAQLPALLGLLVHNLLFLAPALLLLLRWQTPLGTFTVLAGSVALLVATGGAPGLVGLVGAAVLGGAAADVAVAMLRPSPQRRWAARAVAALAPAVWWTAHAALLLIGYGVRVDPQLWLGSVVWASLSGLALALLMWPPAVPLTAWNRGRSPRTGATPAPASTRMVGR